MTSMQSDKRYKMNTTELINKISNGEFDAAFTRLYGEAKIAKAKERYTAALTRYAEIYGESEGIRLFSVPGRSEISGNHTDHNRGKVLAAAVDLDIIAVAAANGGDTVRVKSHGFDMDVVDLSEVKVGAYPKFCSAALIAGVCDGFTGRGYKVGGFNAYTTSDVIKGSGLSSSAAFEVMIGNILSNLFNGGAVDAPTLAMIAKYSENEFFGKPCGLMDQTACAVGGFVYIDFENADQPDIRKVDFDLSGRGYDLCITNTGGSHASLNDDYASIPSEMKSVAALFGKEVLRDITKEDVIENIPKLREKCGDRAVLRALHFLDENERVTKQRTALENGDIETFFRLVIASGESSKSLLQNIFSTKNPAEQGLSLALELSKRYLADKGGAWRVHGGGFAGTVQSIVPSDQTAGFKAYMEKVFGKDTVLVLRIRPDGAIEVK